MGNLNSWTRRFKQIYTNDKPDIKEDIQPQLEAELDRKNQQASFLHKLKINSFSNININRNMHLRFQGDDLETQRGLVRAYRVENRKTVRKLNIDLKAAINTTKGLNRILRKNSTNIEALKFNTHESSFTLLSEHEMEFYKALGYLLRNQLKYLDMDMSVKEIDNPYPKELSILERILTFEGKYLEKLSLKLTENTVNIYVISELSIFDFMKSISTMRHTLKHLALEFTKVVIVNVAGSITEAIKDLYKLEYLKLGINLKSQEFVPSDYMALEMAIKSKSRTLRFLQLDITNANNQKVSSAIIKAINEGLSVGFSLLESYIVNLMSSSVNEAELAAITKGIDLGAPNLKRLGIRFDRFSYFPEDSASIKMFTKAISKKSKGLEKFSIKIGPLEPQYHRYFIELFGEDFSKLKSLDLEHIEAQYINSETEELPIFGIALCEKVKNLEYLRIVLMTSMASQDQVCAIQTLISTNCSTIKHIEIKLAESFAYNPCNDGIKDAKKLLEGLNIQAAKNLTVLKLSFKDMADPNICLLKEVGTMLNGIECLQHLELSFNSFDFERDFLH